MKDFLEKTRKIYYDKRKNLFFNFSPYNRLKKTSLTVKLKDHRFDETFKKQSLLFKEGRIVLACMLVANKMLFSPGNTNNSAIVLYSEDSYFEENPEALSAIGVKLFEPSKDEYCDDDQQIISDVLHDGLVPLFNFRVPEKITFGKKVTLTTFLFERKHSPNRYIDRNLALFPLLICPEKTEASIMLPSKYWAT